MHVREKVVYLFISLSKVATHSTKLISRYIESK